MDPLEQSIAAGITKPKNALAQSIGKALPKKPMTAIVQPASIPATTAITFYSNNEDKYGATTAHKNPLTGKEEALPMLTVAGPDWLAGKWVEINGKKYYVNDRGGDVEANVAGKARNQPMTIDIYAGPNMSRTQLDDLNQQFGTAGSFKIVDPPTAQELDSMKQSLAQVAQPKPTVLASL
jgi:hypothetical protein